MQQDEWRQNRWQNRDIWALHNMARYLGSAHFKRQFGHRQFWRAFLESDDAADANDEDADEDADEDGAEDNEEDEDKDKRALGGREGGRETL